MSRRRGEFEHRTSIFEGAFRAWSHLGGLEPRDFEEKTAGELDPLTNPLECDPRLSKADVEAVANGARRIYPYEPLPRTGLAHPFVQAILSPWLGPEADQDAIQLGLTTLRTWWQHRRKGESGSAVAALGSDKMRGVVEGYTRHFFSLAHCLVTNDKEQPPRSLHAKMKEAEKARNKRNKKRAREEEAGKLAALALNAGLAQGIGSSLAAVNGGNKDDGVGLDPNMTPLERLHAAQRRQLAESGGIHSNISGSDVPRIDVKGKCMPGRLDLPDVVGQVNTASTQLAHRGALAAANGEPGPVPSPAYGDPNSTPVVFVSGTGDIQIAMKVDGITCAHCVKIVETVLRGCNGNKSPINGLLDAAADRNLSSVLIKIDKSSNAKRIAFEAARNLSMVGYTAKAKEMSIQFGADGSNLKSKVDLGLLSTAFEVVAATTPEDVFDWTTPCTCPDNGVVRTDCSRHSQMNTRIFDAFDSREKKVQEYVAGCAMKYGMECTCGPNCTCKNCTKHNPQAQTAPAEVRSDTQGFGAGFNHGFNSQSQEGVGQSLRGELRASRNQYSNVFVDQQMMGSADTNTDVRARRNSSMISFRGSLGGGRMSISSDHTFGRAMSGLSALSIDWENMEGFDVNVDHSANINTSNVPTSVGGEMGLGEYTPSGSNGTRRSSMRRSSIDPETLQNMQVTFKT